MLAGDLELAALLLDLGEQADVLDGDHRLVGEHRHQLDLLGTERLDAVARQAHHARQLAIAHHRHAQHGADIADAGDVLGAIGRVGQRIGHGYRRVAQRHAADQRVLARIEGSGLLVLLVTRVERVARFPVKGAVGLQLEHAAHVGVAQAGRRLDHGQQHRLELEGRVAHDLEHVAGRRLVFERLGQLAVAALDLLEQAHVLDGDHRLRGEGFQELHLFVAERLGLAAHHEDDADRLALAHHRNGERGTIAGGRRDALRFGEARVACHIGDMDDRAVKQRAAGHGLARGRPRIARLQRRHRPRLHAEVGGEVLQRSVVAEQRAVQALAEAHGTAGYGIEHRLHVGR